jgi:hypothetical protein
VAPSFWEGFGDSRELSREELVLFEHATNDSPIWRYMSERQQDYMVEEYTDAMAGNDIRDIIDWLNTLETDWSYYDWGTYRLEVDTSYWDAQDWETWRQQYG